MPNVSNSQEIRLNEPLFRFSCYDHSVLDPISSVDFQSTAHPLVHSEQTSCVCYNHYKIYPHLSMAAINNVSI